MAQSLNLRVDVLEKDSGFIQFNNSALSATQLSLYTLYPLVKPGTTQAFDSYLNWNSRSLKLGGGNVRGTVNLNIVLTDLGNATRVKIHSSWTASNNQESYQVNSEGDLERELERDLKVKLGL